MRLCDSQSKTTLKKIQPMCFIRVFESLYLWIFVSLNLCINESTYLCIFNLRIIESLYYLWISVFLISESLNLCIFKFLYLSIFKTIYLLTPYLTLYLCIRICKPVYINLSPWLCIFHSLYLLWYFGLKHKQRLILYHRYEDQSLMSGLILNC